MTCFIFEIFIFVESGFLDTRHRHAQGMNYVFLVSGGIGRALNSKFREEKLVMSL
jgi:hypothetical protein